MATEQHGAVSWPPVAVVGGTLTLTGEERHVCPASPFVCIHILVQLKEKVWKDALTLKHPHSLLGNYIYDLTFVCLLSFN